MGSIAEALGLSVADVRPIVDAVSPNRVGSTHYRLRSGIYQIWATKSVLVFSTNAATDPPPDPATQADRYPGAYVMVGQLLSLEFVDGENLEVNGSSTIVTGIRVVALDGLAGGTFYCNEFRRRT